MDTLIDYMGVTLMAGSFFLQFLIRREDPWHISIFCVGIALMIPSLLLFGVSMNVLGVFDNLFFGTALKAPFYIGERTSISAFNIVAPPIFIAVGASLIIEWALARRVCK